MNYELLLNALVKAKETQREANELVEEIQSKLVEYAEREQTKTIESGTVRATVVCSERISYNERLLKKALGVKLWNTIKTEKVDASKLKTAMTQGAIDPVIVAQHSTITKSKPFLRLSNAEEATQQLDS